MAVKRRWGQGSSTALSFDSLIDVFMNVLGVLMITAVVLALSTSGRTPSPQKPQSEAMTPPEPVSPPVNSKPEPAIRLSLPQVREAGTRPLYVLISKDGIRPFSGGDLDTTGLYFDILELGSNLVLEPLAGQVMGAAELRSWLGQHDSTQRHLTAVIKPEGAGYYRDVRRIAAEAGFRSGWISHEGDSVVLGEGGRSGSLVQ